MTNTIKLECTVRVCENNKDGLCLCRAVTLSPSGYRDRDEVLLVCSEYSPIEHEDINHSHD